MKICGKCKQEKNFTSFSKRGLGYQSWCKDCSSKNKNSWIKENRDKVKINALWSKYRLRPEDYQKMWDKQDGRCAICFKTTPTEIDHDHRCCSGSTSCGRCVRKILCKRCNILVGFLEKEPDITRKALRYSGF